jgi:hypothetical protein
MPLARSSFAVLLALGACVVAAPPASADVPQACLVAHESSQKLRADGKLREARAELLSCAQETCPKLVRQDCTEWLSQVEASMPTVVVGARDAAGQDVLDARVLFDGREIAARLDGKPIAVDPGPHTLRVEMRNGAATEEKIVIREGEKDRVVVLAFGAPKKAGAHAPASPAVSGAADQAPRRGVPASVFVLGAVGVVGLGAFAYLGGTGTAKLHDMRDTCAPSCDPSDVDAVKTKIRIGDAALAVGVVSLGAAAIIALSHSGARETTAASAPPVDVHPVAGGAVAALRGRF